MHLQGEEVMFQVVIPELDYGELLELDTDTIMDKHSHLKSLLHLKSLFKEVMSPQLLFHKLLYLNMYQLNKKWFFHK